MKPSVQDVARAAGVGASTVSRVLNGRPNISARAQQRVMDAVQRLGYVPDLNARMLRRGQTHAVSVLLPMTGTTFYETLLTALDGALGDAGYDMALFPLLGQAPVRRHRDPGALMYRADALLIASQNPHDLYGGPPPFRGPTVLVDAHHPHYHSVSFDNLAAGRLAAEHALAQRRPLVFLDGADQPGVPGSPVFVDRRTGVLQRLAEAGVRPWHSLSIPTSRQGFEEAARMLLAQPGPASFVVLAMSDDLALGLQGALQDAGRHPHHRLIGFDGSPEALAAGVDSVWQPVHDMGLAAAQVLLGAVRGDLTAVVSRSFTPALRLSPLNADLPPP